MQIYPVFSSVSVCRTLILNDLYVDESFRNQGIATLLLNKARTYALSKNVTSISLETTTDNHTARALYERHGYCSDNQLMHYTLRLSN